jgi:hypothetical protein
MKTAFFGVLQLYIPHWTMGLQATELMLRFSGSISRQWLDKLQASMLK